MKTKHFDFTGANAHCITKAIKLATSCSNRRRALLRDYLGTPMHRGAQNVRRRFTWLRKLWLKLTEGGSI